jgi:hypothetical protein
MGFDELMSTYEKAYVTGARCDVRTTNYTGNNTYPIIWAMIISPQPLPPAYPDYQTFVEDNNLFGTLCGNNTNIERAHRTMKFSSRKYFGKNVVGLVEYENTYIAGPTSVAYLHLLAFLPPGLGFEPPPIGFMCKFSFAATFKEKTPDYIGD